MAVSFLRASIRLLNGWATSHATVLLRFPEQSPGFSKFTTESQKLFRSPRPVLCFRPFLGAGMKQVPY
jgi:hypothetical protein